MRFIVFIASFVGLIAAPSISAAGDISEGKKLYRKCMACHFLEEHRRGVGPHFAGLFGRKAASVPNFRYSHGLSAAGEKGLIWSAESVSGYLSGEPGPYEAWRSDRGYHMVMCKKGGTILEVKPKEFVMVDCAVPLGVQNLDDLSAYLSSQ